MAVHKQLITFKKKRTHTQQEESRTVSSLFTYLTAFPRGLKWSGGCGARYSQGGAVKPAVKQICTNPAKFPPPLTTAALLSIYCGGQQTEATLWFPRADFHGMRSTWAVFLS